LIFFVGESSRRERDEGEREKGEMGDEEAGIGNKRLEISETGDRGDFLHSPNTFL
jgi:hypothetical protein